MRKDINVEIIKVYETKRSRDLNDGIGEVHVGYFTDKNDAEKAGEEFKTFGGGRGHWVEKTEIIIFNSYKEYTDQRDHKILEGVKQRLTDEEKRVLGLT